MDAPATMDTIMVVTTVTHMVATGTVTAGAVQPKTRENRNPILVITADIDLMDPTVMVATAVDSGR